MSAPSPGRHASVGGLAYAFAAYAWWGVTPLFWKHLTHVPVLEILGHRIVWAFPIFAGLLWIRGGIPQLARRAGAPEIRWAFVASSVLLAVNWLTFVYAVDTARVLHASLGYFLNPIVSVLLGAIVLGERLTRLQWTAVAFAALGVLQLSAQADDFPWIALVLAGTFGAYGLARKVAPMEALPGSTLEVTLLLPLAAAYLVWLATKGQSSFTPTNATTAVLLAATGVITALPLLWFANAARRLRLSTIGFIQYLAPTGQFLLAVLAFGEAFTPLHQRSFACIWAGIALFTLESWRQSRRGG